MFGPHFGSELTAAGLTRLPIAWTPTGEITGRDALSPAQDAALQAVIDAHEPDGPGALAALRADAIDQIDAAAEQARLVWITGGAGQAMVYQRKAEEAKAFEAVVAGGGTPDPADYPILAAEVGITAPDLPGVVTTVQGLDAAWAQVAAAIEVLRLGAKATVAAAETAEAIQAATEITWPVPA